MSKKQTFLYLKAIGRRKGQTFPIVHGRKNGNQATVCAINIDSIAYFFPDPTPSEIFYSNPYRKKRTGIILKNGDRFYAEIEPKCFADLIEEKLNVIQVIATSNDTSNDKTVEILNKLKELLELSESDPLAKESQILYDHVKWTLQEALDDTSRIHENDQSRAEGEREQRTERSTSGISEGICPEEESSDER